MSSLNLPNVITVGRIAVAPLVALLPFSTSNGLRLAAFLLYVVAAVTDFVDGWLARDRNLVTRVGKLLDPLADKVLLVASLVPTFVLMAPREDWLARGMWWLPSAMSFQFVTPWGSLGLSWWVVAVVIGRELFMTAFRQLAARRGVTIAAIGAAKWKTAAQYLWIGAAYFWIFARSTALAHGWHGPAWHAFAAFNGTVGAVAMLAAVSLTLYSLALYLHRYGGVLIRQPVSH